MTVYSVPVVSGGVGSLCVGETASVAFTSGGVEGDWSVSAFATISSSGLVTGTFSGTGTVYFTSKAGCRSVGTPITVKAVPVLSGGGFVCPQRFVILTAADSGTWSSSSGAVSLSTNGPSSSVIVSYVSQGSATVTFTASNGCVTTKSISSSTACSSVDETGTTCEQIRSGTAVALPGVFYSTSRKSGRTLISQVNPGVFFYDSFIAAPAAQFTVCVKQLITTGWPQLKIQSADKGSQFIIWSDSCAKIASTGRLANK